MAENCGPKIPDLPILDFLNQDWRYFDKAVKARFKRAAVNADAPAFMAKLHYDGFINGDVKAASDWMLAQGDPLMYAARLLNRSRYERTWRLRKRIFGLLLTGNAFFVTLTFRPEVFESTSQKSRRKYVTRYLKSHTKYYVANIDFGSHRIYVDSSGVDRTAMAREHYHAVVFGRLPESMSANGRKSPDWPLGFSKQQAVHVSHKSVLKLPRYLTKLTYHAIKESTVNDKGNYFGQRSLYSKLTLLEPDDFGNIFDSSGEFVALVDSVVFGAFKEGFI